MKKLALLVVTLLTSLVLIGCNTKDDEYVLKVGVVAPPMSTVIELSQERFEAITVIDEEGETHNYKLEIIRFTDYDIINHALNDGEIDLNFSQHELYMNEFNNNHNGTLVHLQGIYTTANYLYSTKYNDISDITKDSVIGIAREPINLNRALRFLKDLGLVNFDDNITGNITIEDITKTIEFELELFELTGLPKFFVDIDAAVMYPSFGMQADLEVGKDTIAKEANINSAYDISIVGREDNKDSKIVRDFIDVVTSQETVDFLKGEFGDTYEIVFDVK